MASRTETAWLSDDEIVARFVGRLHEEFKKTESMPALRGAYQQQRESEAHHNTRTVAAWDGKSRLSADEFIKVRCREMSASGISFWVKNPPSTPFFVVKFDMGDETVFVKTRVLHANPDLTMDNASYLVASKFAGRVDSDAMPASMPDN